MLIFFHPHIWKVFSQIQISDLTNFYQFFKDVTPLCSTCLIPEKKFLLLPILCFCRKSFFFLAITKIFTLFLGFSSLTMRSLGGFYLVFILLQLWASCICGLLSFINLKVISSSNSSVLFSISCSGIREYMCLDHLLLSYFSQICSFFSHSFFSLWSISDNLYWYIIKLTDSFFCLYLFNFLEFLFDPFSSFHHSAKIFHW